MTDAPGARTRLQCLTSLRFVAAFVVFMHHAGPVLPGEPLHRLTSQGAIGVSFFFVLSGFVLTWSRPQSDTFGSFFRRRFARVWPAHVAAFVLFLGASYRPLRSPVTGGIAGSVLSVLLVQAWVPHETIYFAGNALSWSLSCEVFFYATFPFLVRRIAALSSGSRTWLAVALIALTFVIAAATPPGDHPLWLWFRYISPPVRLAEFVLGILVALLVEEGRWRKVPLWIPAVLTVAAYVVAGYAPRGFAPVAVTIVPISVLIGTVAVHELAGHGPRVLLTAWVIRLGIWSFAFYLVHQFVLATVVTMLVRRRGASLGVLATADVVGFVVALAGAALLHRFVEKPLERRLRGTPRASVSLG